jgi:hypothetical protein
MAGTVFERRAFGSRERRVERAAERSGTARRSSPERGGSGPRAGTALRRASVLALALAAGGLPAGEIPAGELPAGEKSWRLPGAPFAPFAPSAGLRPARGAGLGDPNLGEIGDPEGDTIGEQAAQPDITRFRMHYTQTDIFIAVEFAAPITPPSPGNLAGVVAVVDIDADQNPSTGVLEGIVGAGEFCPPFGLGVDFTVVLGLPLRPGELIPIAVLNLEDFDPAAPPVLEEVGEISYGERSFTVRVPSRAVGSASGSVDAHLIVGTAQEPTDCAPDGDFLVSGPAIGPFVRGDCRGEGVEVAVMDDALFLLDHLFLEGPPPPCLAACDANGDGRIFTGVSDVIYVLNFHFRDGAPPRSPFPDCQVGTTDDLSHGCEMPPESCPD